MSIDELNADFKFEKQEKRGNVWKKGCALCCGKRI